MSHHHGVAPPSSAAGVTRAWWPPNGLELRAAPRACEGQLPGGPGSLKKALGQVLAGVTWQRCRVHFTLAPHCVRRSAGVRNLLAHVPQRDKSMVAAMVRMVFAQPNRQVAGQQLAETVTLMAKRWPTAAALRAAAEDDVLAYMAFPPEHWCRASIRPIHWSA